ncbi:MAG: hypothetical protein K0U47_12180, partial [Epsilonproteobacteria bacterium]|nr:hypothetical protein [Campylobacterota bacterium]
DSRYLQIGTAIVAAKPRHPILKHVIRTMRKSYMTHKGAPEQTGPKHFTRAFFDVFNMTDTIDIIFLFKLYCNKLII